MSCVHPREKIRNLMLKKAKARGLDTHSKNFRTHFSARAIFSFDERMSASVEYRLPRSPGCQNTSSELFCTHLVLHSARQLYLYKTLPARLCEYRDNFSFPYFCYYERQTGKTIISRGTWCTGWKEKFVRGYYRRILNFRFHGNTCNESAAKLTLTLNFFLDRILLITKVKGTIANSFSEKWQKSFLII